MSTQKRFLAKYGLDGNGLAISNVADPVDAQDAATKNFSSNASNLDSGTLGAARLPAFTGDATSSAGSSALTLATVNADVGTYAGIQVNAKGLVIGATALTTLAQYGITDSISASILGQPNGVATLDSGGKVTASQLPSSVIGAVSYQGGWNANTNSPGIVSGVGTTGYFYKVTTAGSTNIDGISAWTVGDSIIFNGTVWEKLDGLSSEVISVAGRYGEVVLTSADIGGLAASATTDTTNASNISSGTLGAARLPAFTGDATSSAGSSALTLATVASAGTYDSVTINEKGLVTSGTSGTHGYTHGSATSGTLTTTTTTPNQTLDSFLSATYRTVEYLVQISSGSAYHSLRLLINHDGTNVNLLEYADIASGAVLGTFDASISAGTLTVTTTPTNAATTYKFIRTSLNV